MKEFEKWLENPDIKFWLIDYVPFDAARAGWREALKWMKKTAQDLDCGDMEDSIDEELQDGSK